MRTPAFLSQQPSPSVEHNDGTTLNSPRPVTQLKAFLTITCAILVTHALCAQSQLTTLDFNGLTAMADIPGSPVPISARLSDQFLRSQGVLFSSDSGSPYVAVVSFPDGNIGIASVDADNRLSYSRDYNAGFSIGFFLPSDPSVMAATDQVSIRFNSRGQIALIAAMETFDADGQRISGDYRLTGQGDYPLANGPYENGPAIHSARFSGPVGWDDLTFNSALTPVPEPSAFALGALGALLLLAGARLRARQIRS